MSQNKPNNTSKPNTNFDHRGTNVPTQPKVPPMPAPKPVQPFTTKGNK